MAETRHNDLAYGHYGECIYDPNTQAWSWPRDVQALGLWTPLGHPTQISSGSTNAARSGIGSNVSNGNPTLETFLQHRPATVPALDFLRDSIRLGPGSLLETTTPPSAQTDDSRLLVTRLPLDRSRRGRLVDTICLATSDASATLWLLPCDIQKQGWGRDRHAFIRVPRPSNERFSWNAPSTILQITASHSIDNRKPLLAVRTYDQVFILWPHVETIQSASCSLRTPQLLCTVLCTIPAPPSPQSRCVDVAFNPWYHWQFGLVEANGTWRIFELARDHKGQERRLQQACFGTIDATPSTRPRPTVAEDDWAKILWAGNPSTLIVCRRTSATLIDVSGKIVTAPLPDFGIRRGAWILDAHRDLSKPDNFYVLTSSHLVKFHLQSTDPESLNDLESSGGISIVFKVPHFRDQLDRRMSLSLVTDESSTFVVISSPSSTSSAVFPMHDVEFPAAQSGVLGDASLMPILLDTASIYLQFLPWGGSSQVRSQDAPQTIARLLQSSGCSFWLATSLVRGRGVTQQIICRVPPGRSQALEAVLTAPKWRDRLLTYNRLGRDTFVVSDALDDVKDGLVAGTALLGIRTASGESAGKSSTFDFQSLYSKMNRVYTDAGEDWNDVFERIRAAANCQPESDSMMRLLSDFAPNLVIVNNLEQDNTSISDLVHSLGFASEQTDYDPDHEGEQDRSSTNVVALVASPRCLGMGDFSENAYSLTSIYDRMVGRWVAPLSDSIPGRMRLAKEQLARTVAAQVYLASHKCMPPPIVIERQQPESQQVESLDLSGDQPQNLGQSSQMSSRAASTQPSSRSTSTERRPEVLQAALADLKRYASFTAPTTPSTSQAGTQSPQPLAPDLLPDSMPRTALRVLDAWTIGTNPDEHDWTSRPDTDSQADVLSRLGRHSRKRQLARQAASSQPVAATPAWSRAPEIALSQGLTSRGGMTSQFPSRATSSQPLSRATSVARPLTGLSSTQPPAGAGAGAGTSRSRDWSRLGDTNATLPGVARGERVQTRSQTARLSQGEGGSSQRGLVTAAASQIEPGRHGGRLVVQLPGRKRKRVEGF